MFMTKIIAAFDGLRFSESAMEYAIYLAQQSGADLTGVFLCESTRAGYAMYEALVEQSVPGKAIVSEIDKTDVEVTNKAVEAFESSCSAAKINYIIHSDKKNPNTELLHETLFADLLIIDTHETFSYLELSLPGRFIQNILHKAQCPVIVVPKKFTPIKKLALLYDGTVSSVHAIKMLDYILPWMKELETKLFYANHEAGSSHLPDNKLLKEWMKRHYPKVEYKVVKGHEKELAATLAGENPGFLIVTGAYHRSSVSMWLHRSLADLLMNEIKAPIFIAHI